MGIAIFALGLVIAAMTFVNAYVAQGAIVSDQSSAFGTVLRRPWPELYCYFPAAFPCRHRPCGCSDLT
jgi:hypothetical protein